MNLIDEGWATAEYKRDYLMPQINEPLLHNIIITMAKNGIGNVPSEFIMEVSFYQHSSMGDNITYEYRHKPTNRCRKFYLIEGNEYAEGHIETILIEQMMALYVDVKKNCPAYAGRIREMEEIWRRTKEEVEKAQADREKEEFLKHFKADFKPDIKTKFKRKIEAQFVEEMEEEKPGLTILTPDMVSE